MKNSNIFYLIVLLLLISCSCDHDSCKMDEILFKRSSNSGKESLKPWEKSQDTVSGVKKEEVRLKRSILTLNTQATSSKEVILKRKREEEKKSSSRDNN